MKKGSSPLIVLVIMALLTTSCGSGIRLGTTNTPTSSMKTPTDTVSPSQTLTITPTIELTRTPTKTPTRTATSSSTATHIPRRTPEGIPLIQVCQQSVTGMRNLTRNLEIPEGYFEEGPIRTEDDFDVNSYFSVLNHLDMEDGYVLDFVYFLDHLGGKPLIYARPINKAPYQTYAEFIEAVGEPTYIESSYGYLEHAHDFMEFIRTDDTAEAYLQLIILAVLVDQFYLFWHGAYNDLIFLCDISDIDQVIDEVAYFGAEIQPSILEGAQQLDVAPYVSLEDDKVTIRYMIFTKWGGFIDNWYTVTREFPHTAIDGGSEVLIEYDCGINF